ncbi:MAG: HAMP domain-containing protein [Syntrophobacterales bacterium]|nr:MAG: HAMP domain-containing protein [Syntrophobacterales bacterium]
MKGLSVIVPDVLRRRIRFGIHLKFILVTVLLILLTSTTMSWFFITREVNLIQANLRHKGETLVRTLANSSLYSVITNNQEMLKTLVRGAIREEEVVFCLIQDAQGGVLAKSYSAANAGKKRELHLLVCSSFIHTILLEGDEIAQQKDPVSFRDSRVEIDPLSNLWQGLIGKPVAKNAVGVAHLGLSLHRMDRELAEVKRNVGILILVVVGIGILITILLVDIIVNPIGQLVSATRRITRGDLSHPVAISTNDEIGDLARSFNQMVRQLEDSRKELEDYSITLERKVEERTTELEHNVTELSEARMATLNILEDINEAKKELEKANRELIEMDEMKSKFLGTASHELKTPLTAIKANVDFILSGREGPMPRNFRQYLVTIQRNTNRIQEIMEKMLDMARIKAGKIDLLVERVNLLKAVKEYVKEIKPVEKRIDIKIKIPRDIHVEVDKNRLHDIYINLLSNAFRFTSPGGEVKIGARRDNDVVLAEVSDSGVGIPEDQREKVFDEFYQVDRKRYGGTGLGLTIVKGIVEEHGGKIWVDSEVGRGSTFYFTVPLAR